MKNEYVNFDFHNKFLAMQRGLLIFQNNALLDDSS